MCEFHAKKIRKRKSVGQIGMVQFEYIPRTRRFVIAGNDYVQDALNRQQDTQTTMIKPNINFYEPHRSDPFGDEISTEQTPF
jgi:hypothetical protein